MSEEKAKAVVKLFNDLAEARATQKVWLSLGHAGNTATCAEKARETMHLLEQALMADEE